jgi:WD40 repeat protein
MAAVRKELDKEYEAAISLKQSLQRMKPTPKYPATRGVYQIDLYDIKLKVRWVGQLAFTKTWLGHLRNVDHRAQLNGGRTVAKCLSPNGKYFAIGMDDNRIEIWLVNSWTKMATVDFSHVLPTHLTSIDISPDGRSFVASFFLAESAASWPVLESTKDLTEFAKQIIPQSGDRSDRMLNQPPDKVLAK